MNDRFNPGDDRPAGIHALFTNITESLKLEKPTVASQREYLEKARHALDVELYNHGTYVRLFDTLPATHELDENWNVHFFRNGNDELSARVNLYDITTQHGTTTRHKSHTLFMPITARNDASENTPVGRFDDGDARILHTYFDGLIADKTVGILPNLSANYDIFDPATAIQRLGTESTHRSKDTDTSQS